MIYLKRYNRALDGDLEDGKKHFGVNHYIKDKSYTQHEKDLKTAAKLFKANLRAYNAEFC